MVRRARLSEGAFRTGTVAALRALMAEVVFGAGVAFRATAFRGAAFRGAAFCAVAFRAVGFRALEAERVPELFRAAALRPPGRVVGF
jgi:hypothetical protein